jgi:mRNA-degrading endonuclease YafQ of YafQ-DinJ toxin-antitoxin module
LAFLANLMPPNSSKISELIATERDYIFQLEMCHRIYIRTFRRQQQMEGPPKYTEHQLFGNWTQIRHFHRR